MYNPLSDSLCNRLRDSICDLIENSDIPKDYSSTFTDSEIVEKARSKYELSYELVIRSNKNPNLMFGIISEVGNNKHSFLVGKDDIKLGSTRLTQMGIFENASKLLGGFDGSDLGSLGVSAQDYQNMGNDVVFEATTLIKKYYPKLHKAILNMI